MAKSKINFRQTKYVLPAILYLPLIAVGWLVIDLFQTDVAETADPRLTTTNYLNDKLPDAKVRELGDKRSNMNREFGGISDLTAVEGVQPDSLRERDEYGTQYSEEEAELIALQEQERERDSQARMDELQRTLERNIENGRRMQSNDFEGQLTYEERQMYQQMRRNDLLAEMRRQLAESGDSDIDERMEETNDMDSTSSTPGDNQPLKNAVTALSDDDQENIVVKKVNESSAHFNTLSENESESYLIKAIVDEETKAVDGARVRLRLLDDIDIGGRTLPKGTYLYATVSGFGSQRVKGSIRSVMVDDNLLRVSLNIYDMDGLEGLYVPESALMETAKDVAASATQQGTLLENNTSHNSVTQWANQAVQNAYSRTFQAIGRAIRRNKVRIKYGTQVYLVNGNGS